jgi:ABC-type Mn2+/Zn2+ transport system permease subunit
MPHPEGLRQATLWFVIHSVIITVLGLVLWFGFDIPDVGAITAVAGAVLLVVAVLVRRKVQARHR